MVFDRLLAWRIWNFIIWGLYYFVLLMIEKKKEF